MRFTCFTAIFAIFGVCSANASSEPERRSLTRADIAVLESVLWGDVPYSVDVTWVFESSWKHESEADLRRSVSSTYRRMVGRGLAVPVGDQVAFDAAVESEVQRLLIQQQHPKLFRQRIRSQMFPHRYRLDQVQLQPENGDSASSVREFEVAYINRGHDQGAGYEAYKFDFVSEIATRDDKAGAGVVEGPVWCIGRISGEIAFALRALLLGTAKDPRARMSDQRVRDWMNGQVPKMVVDVAEFVDDRREVAVMEARFFAAVSGQNTLLYRWRFDKNTPTLMYEFESAPSLKGQRFYSDISCEDFDNKGNPKRLVSNSKRGSVVYHVESVVYNNEIEPISFEFNPGKSWSQVDYRPKQPEILVEGRRQAPLEDAIPLDSGKTPVMNWQNPFIWLYAGNALLLLIAIAWWLRIRFSAR